MNRDTERIAKLLNIGKPLAAKVQARMITMGLDFSECTQREFNRAAREAFQEIRTIYAHGFSQRMAEIRSTL